MISGPVPAVPVRSVAAFAALILASVVSPDAPAVPPPQIAPMATLFTSGLPMSALPAPGGHVPPVDRPILDPFRAPEQPWLAGNRGIEYDTDIGDTIRASADGVVIFAGQVAGSFHVTVRHSAELVTTAAFVASVEVRTGDVVAQGTVLATAGESFHFTARFKGEYIDPAVLFGTISYRVRLIPAVRR